MNIADFLEVELDPSISKRIHRIDGENFSHVAKKTGKDLVALGYEPTTQYLNAGIFALKQYYAVALLDPANAHAVGVRIDPFWHAHMLFSDQYTTFCNETVGEYMHHIPLDHDNIKQVSNVMQLYQYTLEVLPQLFSHVDTRFWSELNSPEDCICFHKGNQDMYLEVQRHRLFEANKKGEAWAYAA